MKSYLSFLSNLSTYLNMKSYLAFQSPQNTIVRLNYSISIVKKIKKT